MHTYSGNIHIKLDGAIVWQGAVTLNALNKKDAREKIINHVRSVYGFEVPPGAKVVLVAVDRAGKPITDAPQEILG